MGLAMFYKRIFYYLIAEKQQPIQLARVRTKLRLQLFTDSLLYCLRSACLLLIRLYRSVALALNFVMAGRQQIELIV